MLLWEELKKGLNTFNRFGRQTLDEAVLIFMLFLIECCSLIQLRRELSREQTNFGQSGIGNLH